MSLSSELQRLIASAEAGKTNDQKFMDRHMQEALAALLMWVESHDAMYQWNASEGLNGTTASTAAPTAGLLTYTAEGDLTDAANIPDAFRQNGDVTVSITGGSATAKKINGGTAPVVLTMVDGKATLTATATSTGTLILGLSAPHPASADVTDVLTITFS